MTLKEKYAVFCTQWKLTHNISRPPCYKNWRDYYQV